MSKVKSQIFSIYDENPFKTAFKGNHDYLAHNLYLETDVLMLLIDSNVISSIQYESIKSYLSYDRVDQLIANLEKRNFNLFVPFCRILRDTDQKVILKRILNNFSEEIKKKIYDEIDSEPEKAEFDCNESEKFKTALQGNTFYLGTNLDLSDSMLLMLQDYKVITENEKQQLKAEKVMIERISELIKILYRKNTDSDKFNFFCKVLCETDHTNILQKMLEKFSKETQNKIQSQLC